MNIDTSLLLFCGLQLINVILSTVRAILTVNGSRSVAVISNTVAYTFSSVVTKLLTEQSFAAIIVVTIITNLVGVYIGKGIIDRIKPEHLWTIVTTIRTRNIEAIEKKLRKSEIQYTIMPAKNDRHLVTIFSYTKAESVIIRDMLHEVGARYSITENRMGF